MKKRQHPEERKRKKDKKKKNEEEQRGQAYVQLHMGIFVQKWCPIFFLEFSLYFGEKSFWWVRGENTWISLLIFLPPHLTKHTSKSFPSHFLSKIFHPPYFTSKQTHPKLKGKNLQNYYKTNHTLWYWLPS